MTTETPFEGRYWCQLCEPSADPIAEILIPRTCFRHQVETPGADDERASVRNAALYSSEQADGAACRAIQSLITRRHSQEET